MSWEGRVDGGVGVVLYLEPIGRVQRVTEAVLCHYTDGDHSIRPPRRMLFNDEAVPVRRPAEA